MNSDVYAELRFPDDGTVAFGALACVNGKTLTVRIVEHICSDLFRYGRSAELAYACPEGMVNAPCRLVAENDSKVTRDIVVVLTGTPTVVDRRESPRLPCRLEAAFRALRNGQAYGA